jgi:hypothetical protein
MPTSLGTKRLILASSDEQAFNGRNNSLSVFECVQSALMELNRTQPQDGRITLRVMGLLCWMTMLHSISGEGGYHVCAVYIR